MRDARWAKAFHGKSKKSDQRLGPDSSSRATILLELIIQASDVAHAMQHFTVYKMWNIRLLTEMCEAYKCGRSSKDPLEGWYEGDLCFFDNYAIPLDEKLRECEVFGVSCHEFLDYARDNRLEWHVKSRDIVRAAVVALRMGRGEVNTVQI